MTAPAYLRQLAKKCNHISSELSDESGFVGLKRLVARFDAELLVRPLLVEAMLSSTESASTHAGTGRRHRWCVLLDKETYDLKSLALSHESSGAPLPPRLRNTVAHELAHSLAFRATEFGVELPKKRNPTKNKRDFVDLI